MHPCRKELLLKELEGLVRDHFAKVGNFYVASGYMVPHIRANKWHEGCVDLDWKKVAFPLAPVTCSHTLEAESADAFLEALDTSYTLGLRDPNPDCLTRMMVVVEGIITDDEYGEDEVYVGRRWFRAFYWSIARSAVWKNVSIFSRTCYEDDGERQRTLNKCYQRFKDITNNRLSLPF